MTIIPYEQTHRQILSSLLTDYFTELGSDIPEQIIHGKLMDLIERQCRAGIIHTVIAVTEDLPIGFSIFQIDSTESDWCKRPGWGFIREFYIIPAFRKKGMGRLLARYTEDALRHLGTRQLYLTADNATAFWQRCGWRLTPDIASNELSVLEKE